MTDRRTVVYRLVMAVAVVVAGCGYGWFAGQLSALMGVTIHGWDAPYNVASSLYLVPLAAGVCVFFSTKAGRCLGYAIWLAALGSDVWLILATAKEGFGHLGKVMSALPWLFLIWFLFWFGWQLAFGWLLLHATREASSYAPDREFRRVT